MARKSPRRPEGTLVVLEFESKILADNPLGDPHVRKLAVWLPPALRRGRGPRARPALAGALRPRRLHRLGTRAPQLAAVRRERARARRAARRRAQDGAGDPRLPGLLHVPRRQPVRELERDRALRRLPDAGDRAARRSRVPHARLARAPRLLRQVVGRLRRDHPRHEVRAALGRDRRPLGRRLLRLLLHDRLAAHAERARPLPQAAAPRRPHRRRPGREGVGARRGRRPRAALPRGDLVEGEAERRRGPRADDACDGGDLRSRPAGAARLPAAARPRDRRGDRGAVARAGSRTTRSTSSRATARTSRRSPASTSTAAGATSTTCTTARASCRGIWRSTASRIATRSSTTTTRRSTTGWT